MNATAEQADLLVLDAHTGKDLAIFEPDAGGTCLHEGRLHFDYLLRPGLSNQRLGMRVLREEGVLELLDGEPVDRPGPGCG